MRVAKTPRFLMGSRRGFGPRFMLLKRLGFLSTLLTLIGIILAPAIVGATTLISQGYTADTALAPGSIVSLKKDSISDVSSATISNAGSILGVVITDGNSQLSVSSNGKNQVQVVTNGIERVLVSDINGKINAGDEVTASPISGVGMKVSTTTKVVGVAQDSFPNSTSTDQTYKDKSGQTHKAKIGQVPVLVNVAYFYKQPDKTIVPATLQNLANTLAGKTVNTLPIIISVAIFIITLIVVVSIVYSLIHSSIISVGRNPMAQSAVYRNVIQLSLLVVIILAVSVVAIYMVLRKL